MLTIQILLSSALSKCRNWKPERLSDSLKSQGRKELALSLQPTFWTLAQCLSIAHTYLRIVLQIGWEQTVWWFLFQEGRRKVMFLKSHVQMAVLGLLMRVKEQRPLQLYSDVSVGLFFTRFSVASASTYLWPSGRTQGQGMQSAEHVSSMQWGSGLRTLLLSLLFSTECVSAWNYKAGTNRCISRCSRVN